MVSKTFGKYASVAQFGVGMLFLSFSRSDEREADSLGVEYSAKAGYDSNHMANLFVSLERLNPGESQGGLPGWFSTHPNPENRIAAVKQDTLAWREKIQQTQFSVNRDQYLRQIDGIVFGEDPRQGYVEGNVFYHPQLRFQFPVPGGWKVNNTASQVQMINQQQNAVILFSMAPEKNPAGVECHICAAQVVGSRLSIKPRNFPCPFSLDTGCQRCLETTCGGQKMMTQADRLAFAKQSGVSVLLSNDTAVSAHTPRATASIAPAPSLRVLPGPAALQLPTRPWRHPAL